MYFHLAVKGYEELYPPSTTRSYQESARRLGHGFHCYFRGGFQTQKYEEIQSRSSRTRTALNAILIFYFDIHFFILDVIDMYMNMITEW